MREKGERKRWEERGEGVGRTQGGREVREVERWRKGSKEEGKSGGREILTIEWSEGEREMFLLFTQ